MSNLKQIGLGVVMYTQDYDGKYPVGAKSHSIWHEEVSPYISNFSDRTQIYRCPDSYLKIRGGNHSDFFHGNYGANGALFSFWSDPVVSLAQVASPSTTYMILDFGTAWIQSWKTFSPTGTSYLPGTGPGTATNLPGYSRGSFRELKGDYISGRHFGGVNMLFADGHVKWLKSHKVVLEAIPCGSGSCRSRYTHSLHRTAWNPYVGG